GSSRLPCGFLYGFGVWAAGTGSAARGALLLAAFWLGTVPALLGVGLAVRVLSSPLRRHVPTLTALALLAVGLWTLLARVNLPAQSAHAVRESVNLLTQDAKPSPQPAPGATCHHRAPWPRPPSPPPLPPSPSPAPTAACRCRPGCSWRSPTCSFAAGPARRCTP